MLKIIIAEQLQQPCSFLHKKTKMASFVKLAGAFSVIFPFYDKIIRKRAYSVRKKSYICRCYCPLGKYTSRGVYVTVTASISSDDEDDDGGQALHCGKASHDALSTGFLKLPQKVACQRHSGV